MSASPWDGILHTALKENQQQDARGLRRWKVPVPEQVELNQLGTAGIRGAETI